MHTFNKCLSQPPPPPVRHIRTALPLPVVGYGVYTAHNTAAVVLVLFALLAPKGIPHRIVSPVPRRRVARPTNHRIGFHLIIFRVPFREIAPGRRHRRQRRRRRSRRNLSQ